MAGAREALEKLLESLGESCRFVASGSLAPVLPGLVVEGVGAIGLPATAADAKRLIAQASQAPYGRGEETIIDPKVRRVWQIEPTRMAFLNTEWKAHLAGIVEAVAGEFGIQHKIGAELYKLLIYEPGSFFAPHRDTEKTQGMFATLVVCLPSRHDGGTLIVEHDGQTEKIDFGGADSEFNTHYAAFYADCQHEIAPVTSGYRLCLVYNLAIAGKKRQPAAPKNAAAVGQASQLLQELLAGPAGAPSKLAIPFQHQYTEAGLNPSQLKGSDRARADVLVRAAESLDYECNLALLTHYQSGGVDYDTWGYDPYRSRRFYRSSEYEDDEEEDGDDDGSDDKSSGVEMGEVFDESISLNHWLDPRGRKQPLGEIHLEEDEILGGGDRKGWPRRQEIREATGNEGASMERWYRRAVLVIWPRDRYFRILAGEGQATALPALEQLASRAKQPAALAELRAFAAEIIGQWRRRHAMGVGDRSSGTGRMLKVLARHGDAELVGRYVREVLPRDFDGSEGKMLQRLFQRLGWGPFAAGLRDFLAQQQPTHHFTSLSAIAAICEALCCAPPALSAERRAVCASLVDPLEQVLERWDAAANSWQRRDEKRAGIVEKVVHCLAMLSASEHLDRFLARLLSDRAHYDLHAVLIPDVKAIHQWLPGAPAAEPAATRLLLHCIAELRTATAHPVEPPRDWSRDAELACKCAQCRELSQFLRNPEQNMARFPLRKDLREHLHQQIDKHRCDCTHVTQRKGSPHVLVCTKTQASYERRKKQYEVDRKLLAELEALAAGQRAPAAKRAPRQRKLDA